MRCAAFLSRLAPHLVFRNVKGKAAKKCLSLAESVKKKHFPPAISTKTTVNHHVSLLVMDVLNPHATHPFGVRAVRLTHFVPSGDVLAYGQLPSQRPLEMPLAYGQPASQRPLGTSWPTASLPILYIQKSKQKRRSPMPNYLKKLPVAGDGGREFCCCDVSNPAIRTISSCRMSGTRSRVL